MVWNSIETFILERRMDTHARQQEMYNLHRAMIGKDVCINDFWSSSLSNSPSNDIISKIFLAQFLKDEQLYLRHITSIMAGDKYQL